MLRGLNRTISQWYPFNEITDFWWQYKSLSNHIDFCVIVQEKTIQKECFVGLKQMNKKRFSSKSMNISFHSKQMVIQVNRRKVAISGTKTAFRFNIATVSSFTQYIYCLIQIGDNKEAVKIRSTKRNKKVFHLNIQFELL